MSFTDDYDKLRKKRKQEEEQEKKQSKGNSFTEEYDRLKANRQTGDDDDIAPVVNPYEEYDNSPLLQAMYRFRGGREGWMESEIFRAKREANPDEWYKEDEGLEIFKSGAFSDGYDFGDVTMSILGTAGDAALEAAKGFGKVGEGLGKGIALGAAQVGDWFGADDWAEGVRDRAQKNFIDEWTEGIDKGIEKYSFLGDTTDAILQGVGQVGAVAATGGAGGAGVGTATLFGSSFGNSTSEALQNGASDEEAYTYGLMSASVETISEMIFGGLGKGVNMLGFSKGLSSIDDMAAKAAGKFFKSDTGKNIVQWAVKSGFEGAEEVIAGLGNAAAKKLTYMSEKDLAELVQDENLFEQFFVGAMTSGVIQSGIVPGTSNGSLIDSNKTGRDFISGLSKNEQSVVDKVFKDELAKAEENGKVTNKQKNEIYNEVLERMEKGYIDTDTIEEVLGGDSFKAYKDILDSENALKEEQKALQEEQKALEEEYKQINPKNIRDMTGEEWDRREEIKARLSEIKTKLNEIGTNLGDAQTNAQRNALKAQLDKDVYELTKGDRLRESFFEVVRAKQKYQADLSQYKGRAKDVIQKVMESGLADNTNETHDFWDSMANMAEAMDTDITLADDAQILEMVKAEHEADGLEFDESKFKGQRIDGYISKNGIVLNAKTKRALNFVVGHEITHKLEKTKHYAKLQKLLFEYAKDEYESRFNERSGQYGNKFKADDKYKAKVDKEVTGDLVGDYVFNDKGFIDHLAKDRNVFQRVWDEIKYMAKIVKAGSEQAKQLERVKREFERAYREANKANNGADGTSLSLTGKNKDGIEVYETSQTVMDLTWDERKAKYLEVMKKEYLGRTAKFERNGHTYYAKFDQSSVRKPIYGDSRSSPNGVKALIKAGADGDVFDLVENSQYRGSKVNTKTHTNADYFDYFVKTVQIDGKVFDLMADVEKEYGADEGYVYTLALVDNKKIKASPAHGTPDVVPVNNAGNAYGDKVAQKDPDVKGQFSLSDSDGRQLSNEQAEYFKDSKVRDADGNLKVMYHGTPNGDFTIFKDGTYFTESKEYADKYQNPGASSISTKKTASNPKTYEVYLDIKKPFDISDAEARRVYIDDYIKGGNAVGINPYLSDAEYAKINTIDWTEGEDLREFLIDNGYDYDGLALDEGATGGYGDEVKSRGTSYVVFSPEQVKNTDNKAPTSDPDIRYSLSDASYMDAVNRGDTETAQKMVDEVAKELGYIGTYYHGSKSNFTVFSHDGNGTSNSNASVGYWFTESEEGAQAWADESWWGGTDQGKVYRAYLDLKNPKVYESADNKKQIEELYQGYEDIDKELSLYDAIYYFEDGRRYHRERYDYDKSRRRRSGIAEWDAFKAIVKKYDADSIDYYLSQVSENERQAVKDDAKRYLELSQKRKALEKRVTELSYSDAYELFRTDIYKQIGMNAEDANVGGTGKYVENKDDMLKKYVENLKAEGYDGIVIKNTEYDSMFFGNKNNQYVVFDPNQIKSADAVTYNDNGDIIPLSDRFNSDNKDIRYSISDEGQQHKDTGGYQYYSHIPGEDIAPVQEDAAPIIEKPAKVMTEAETSEDLFPDDLAPMEDSAERLESLDDADAPPENEPYYGEEDAPVAPKDPFEDRDFKGVGKRNVNAYMYDNPEVKTFFQMQAKAMLGDLQNSTKGERLYNDDVYYESGGEYGWSGTQRQTTDDIAYLLDMGYTYAQIEKGLNDIIEDNGEENNAMAKRIEFALNDRLSKGYTDINGVEIPANEEYLNVLAQKETAEAVEGQIAPHTDVDAPMGGSVPDIEEAPVAEDIAPVAEQYEAIRPKPSNEPRMVRADKASESDRVASVLTEEQQAEKKKSNAWSMVKNNVLDKGMVFEDLSLATGNRELQARWNSIRYSEGKAQKLIGEGNAAVKSLSSIRETVEGSGKTKQFYEYLYHMHNIDRMTLEDRFKDVPNKAVFGDAVTADVSREAVAKLEQAYPAFKKWAQDVYDYNSYLRELLVDGGVISSETADLWEEMYPHYVPIRRAGDTGLNINVPLDTGRTGVNAPIKRATGGNSDILPLFDTMGQRTIQTYKAIAKNRFGVELKNTLGTTIANEATDVDEAIDSIDTQDGLLQEGKNGKSPTFTVFENGEKVTFEITDEMYDAMKPKSKGMAYTNKVANTISNIRRGTLTEYNPWFMLKNAVKDVQDILINSQHAARTYASIPEAIKQMSTKGHWYQEYLNNGGDQNTYFDNETATFKKDGALEAAKKYTGLNAISKANNVIEMMPRLAEYIASRKAGRSVDVSMLDAARVTTNFAAGGDLTKMLNRNGFTFLNASVQGAVQQARNIREAKANGLKGWANLATKYLVAGLPALLLNGLIWDDDDEYEELSDYVKENYYIVGKYGDGQFVRIPKGRTVAVIQNAFEQMKNAVTGDDEVDLGRFLELVVSNLAPNNPLDNNILSPIVQVANNETWYGEDLVPTRLQDLPAAEQYDESTDALSRWLGETFDISPYKVNYLLDQYSGVIGDTFLPMMTPEAESGDNSFLGNVIAPLKDMFTTDSVMNNQNVSDFYDTKDELTVNANASGASDEDVLMSKYMNAVNAELAELYKQKREIQNSDMTDSRKYAKVRDIQQQIIELTKNGLNTYEDVSFEDDYREGGEYARIGDMVFKKDDDGEWGKLSDEQLTKYEVTKAAGDASYATDGENHYRWYVPGEDSDAEPGWKKITEDQLEKQEEVTKGLGISPEEYWNDKDEYDYAYKNPGNYAVAKAVGGYDSFKTYSSELYDIKADKDSYGKSISGSRKEKVIDYINGLDADYGEKIILFKSEYKADDTYNYDIIEYLNGREDISYEEMETILKELGFKVDSKGNVTWD